MWYNFINDILVFMYTYTPSMIDIRMWTSIESIL